MASLASAFRSTGITDWGRAAACGPSKGGGSWRCLKMIAMGVSPWNGTRPVKISKATIPTA
jgi:hypothetical protein